jgi:hypothetical protein
VKAGVSLFRCVACMSVSVVSLFWAYKLVSNQRRTDISCRSSLSTPMLALEDGQTILAVVDRQKSMHFYVGNDGEDSSYHE